MTTRIIAGAVVACAVLFLSGATVVFAHEDHAAQVAPAHQEHATQVAPAEASPTSAQGAESEAHAPESNLPRPLAWLGKFHPPLTHFPIALLIAATAWELLFIRSGRALFEHAVRCSVWFGGGRPGPAMGRHDPLRFARLCSRAPPSWERPASSAAR